MIRTILPSQFANAHQSFRLKVLIWMELERLRLATLGLLALVNELEWIRGLHEVAYDYLVEEGLDHDHP